MYVCIYVYVYMFLCICVCVCVWMYVGLCMFLCLYVNVWTYINFDKNNVVCRTANFPHKTDINYISRTVWAGCAQFAGNIWANIKTQNIAIHVYISHWFLLSDTRINITFLRCIQVTIGLFVAWKWTCH